MGFGFSRALGEYGVEGRETLPIRAPSPDRLEVFSIEAARHVSSAFRTRVAASSALSYLRGAEISTVVVGSAVDSNEITEVFFTMTSGDLDLSDLIASALPGRPAFAPRIRASLVGGIDEAEGPTLHIYLAGGDGEPGLEPGFIEAASRLGEIISADYVLLLGMAKSDFASFVRTARATARRGDDWVFGEQPISVVSSA